MKKTALALALFLLCALPLGAMAVHFPEKGTGAVTLSSGYSFSQSVYEDLNAFADRIYSRTGLKLTIAIIYFWDGLQPGDYALELFERWELGEKDLLLVCAEAEKGCAIAKGSAVTEMLGNGPENLLYDASVSTGLQEGNLDTALTAYCHSFAELNGLGGALDTEGLFQSGASQDEPQVTAAPTARPKTSSDSEEGGLTPVGWFLLVVIVLIVISQSDPVRKSRNGQGGCGCSPLGWLLGGFGLSGLISRIFGRRK